MNFKNIKGLFDLPTTYWIVALVGFINSVSFTIVYPLLYPYAKQFDLSDFQASLLLTAFSVSQFIGTPILGRLSDRLGRKPLLIISLLGTVAANIIAAVAPFAWLLFTARILDGFTGGNNSIASAVISDITNAEQRTKAFGIFGSVFSLGLVIGPALSYLALQLPTPEGISSLGLSFLLGASMALFATVLTAFFLPETLPRSEKQEFYLSWSDFGLLKVARSVARPKLGKLFILTFLSGTTFTIFTFAFQPFLLEVLEQDVKVLTIIFVLVGVIGFISQVFALDPLRKRFNLIDILFTALLVRGITFLLIPTFPNITAFFIIIAIFSLITAFPMPLIESILSLNSTQKEQGEVLGTNVSYLSLSNALGPAISGLLVTLGYLAPFWITGVLTVCTALFALQLKFQFKCSVSDQ
ncbi:MFS transporter [Mastigocoleus testarum]|uniref:Multidrug transporter n=1 Tax=Mastigocoleus testarum BC008 TaxID=371196 RepID=A0A0V7ZKX3_9CYAN|nr:MFS transporter [Mastigocoleus testarum]KST65284.1 multidrug transporter [Mastigocoleus testarum BC008]KST65662.1 multidrug transporter [Mastigocoleus testarum BC008]